jgi:aspartate kinase
VALIVQKFGGTSVGSPERIRGVADRVVRARRAGHDVVVVVSAMGDTTDDLLELAAEVVPEPRRRHPRELDMLLSAGERITMALLAMAIRERGFGAISLTGSQAAIITDAAHTVARIEEVRADRVRAELARGHTAIVAGFQGVSRDREITTLGRGGSDTTAVALGAALGAERCDIFTDVDGIFTADPRRVPDARLIRRIDYGEMIEMASSGAQVMHPRAVEIGARYRLPIRVLSSLRHENDPARTGTLITRREATMEGLALTGLASERGYARIILRGLPPGMETMTRLLGTLADAGVSVDMVAQADRADGRRQIQLSVREGSLDEARALCQQVSDGLGGERIDVQTGLSRLTLVGSGMTGVPGVYATAFRALHGAGIEVHGLSTSAISIGVLVESDREEQSLQTLHAAFNLGEAG